MSQVVFIGAGPGDPELITIKGKKMLEKADVVIYTGSLLNPEILKYAKPNVELYDSAKMHRDEVFAVFAKAGQAQRPESLRHAAAHQFGLVRAEVDAAALVNELADKLVFFCVNSCHTTGNNRTSPSKTNLAVRVLIGAGV